MLLLFFFGPGLLTPLFYYQTRKLAFSPQLIGTLGLVSASAGLIASVLYARLCLREPLRVLLAVGALSRVAGVLCYLAYRSTVSATVVEAVNGFCATLAIMPLLDLAARATPKGSEGLGWAVLMSGANFAENYSDVFGSALQDRLHLNFGSLVWTSAAVRLLPLLVVPFLPARLGSRADATPGRRDPESQSRTSPDSG